MKFKENDLYVNANGVECLVLDVCNNEYDKRNYVFVKFSGDYKEIPEDSLANLLTFNGYKKVN